MIRRIAQLVLTAGLLAFLIHMVGWRELRDGLSSARWPWLAAMYGAVAINFAMMAACLRELLAKVGTKVSYARVLFSNALANFYALVLPGDMMAGIAKWAILSAATGQRAKVLSALVLNKMTLAVPPLIFGTIAFAFESPFPQLSVAKTAFGAAVVAFTGFILVFHPRASIAIDRWARAAGGRLPVALRPKAERFFDAFSTFRSFQARDHIELLLLTLAIFWLGILAFFCATRALGLDVPIVTLVWISLALFISRLLPITFNNLGVREGLLILALGRNQVEPALAVSVGLLMFSNAIWIGLIGAACQVAVALGWVKFRD
jgi:uncharacterized membrane protein YbhN (UPF0104 family)